MKEGRVDAIATILASVVNADGKVRSEEISAANSLLELINNNDASDAIEQFEEALYHPDTEVLIGLLKTFAKEAKTSERYELVRNCWYIAGSDMEIHEKEAELVFKFSEFLGVSRKDCLLARKSCTSY